MARGAGRLTGRAAAYLSRSRAAFMKFSDENEITEVCCAHSVRSQPDNLMLVALWQYLRQPIPLQLHKEMQQSLAQLRQIQSELRGGMNVLDPG